MAVMWVRGTAGSVPLRPPLLGAPELLVLWALFASSESRSDIWCSWGGGAEQDDGQMLPPHPVAATGLVVSHCSGGRGMQGRAVPRGGGEGQEKKGPSSWARGSHRLPWLLCGWLWSLSRPSACSPGPRKRLISLVICTPAGGRLRSADCPGDSSSSPRDRPWARMRAGQSGAGCD